MATRGRGVLGLGRGRGGLNAKKKGSFGGVSQKTSIEISQGDSSDDEISSNEPQKLTQSLEISKQNTQNKQSHKQKEKGKPLSKSSDAIQKNGPSSNPNFQYVANASDSKKGQNKAKQYTSGMLKSQFAQINLSDDYEMILNGGCTYLPNFFCDTGDTQLFQKLKNEISSQGEMVNWSQHFKHEDPTFSETFNTIVKQMADKFNVEVIQTRLNYYKDGTDWKPFHKDRHAYGEGANKIREDFTMGASFGASRNLDFLHEQSKSSFSFPQNNGDVFAFNSDINQKFMHGIPKSHQPVGERFSIIAWGQQKK